MSTPRKRPSFTWIAGSLTVLTLAAGTTLAAWTDQAAMEAAFSTGTFGIQINGEDGNPVPVQVPFSITKLQAGDTSSATVTIANTGTEDAWLTLASTAVTGGAEFASALTGAVTTVEEGQLGAGPLETLTTTGSSFYIAPGAERQVTVDVTLDANAGTEVQGQNVTALFTWMGSGIAVAQPGGGGGGGGGGDTTLNRCTEITFNPERDNWQHYIGDPVPYEQVGQNIILAPLDMCGPWPADGWTVSGLDDAQLASLGITNAGTPERPYLLVPRTSTAFELDLTAISPTGETHPLPLRVTVDWE